MKTLGRISLTRPHLHHVLTVLPSDSCREANGHRCGHIRQQHRACFVHRHGELCSYVSIFIHAQTFAHETWTLSFLMLYSEVMRAATAVSVAAEAKKDRCGCSLFTCCGSARIKQMKHNSHRNPAIKALCYWVKQQRVSLQRGEQPCFLFLVTGSFAPA